MKKPTTKITAKTKSTKKAAPAPSKRAAATPISRARLAPAPSKRAVPGRAKEIDVKTAVRKEATILKATEDLVRVNRLRLVARALDARISQDDLAASLDISQASVSRIAALIQSDPSVLDESPTEIIGLRATGQIDSATMMKRLTAHAYSPGQHDPTGGDGYIRGTWREIERALGRGLLSNAEYEQIARKAPVAKPVRAAW